MTFENIHNNYEKQVIDQITRTLVDEQGITDTAYLEDVACLALNRLPPHYVRFDVDNAFFMTDQDRQRMDQAVAEAVDQASTYVRRHRQREI